LKSGHPTWKQRARLFGLSGQAFLRKSLDTAGALFGFEFSSGPS
jgi:hypothetical protein